MEFSKFFRLLLRRKWLLIAIPVATVIITYFLVRHLPDEYVSKARIATGLEDPSQQLISDQQTPQSEIEEKFSNLIQMMLLKKIIDQVSYKLMLHDLTATPFRKPSDDLKKMTDAEKQNAVKIFEGKYAMMDALSLTDQTQVNLAKLLKSMGYDNEAITSKLSVYRENNSDFIAVEFTSENSDLSAFVPNTLCNEFITYYTLLAKDNQRRAVNYLANLLQQKQSKMDSITDLLRNYKIENHVLDLNEQAKSLYGQIADFETRIGLARKDEAAYAAALANIDNRFNPTERKYLESSLTRINQQITNTRDLLSSANEDYVKSNFNPAYQKRIDSLGSVLNEQISESSDKYIIDPLASKKDLVAQKLNMEVQLELTKNSVDALQTELGRLSSKFNSLVPHEAVVQSYENSFDVASKEYLESLAKFNQASLLSNYSVELKQIELALPSTALPSKKILLVAISGIASFIFCAAVLFVLFYLDNSVSSPKELANKTELPVIGFLNKVRTDVNNSEIWKGDGHAKDEIQLKNLMRSIRFEIENEMNGEQILGITSIHAADGKSFFAQNLAYAFAMANKKVMLVNTGNTVNDGAGEKNYIEDYFAGKLHNFCCDNQPVVTLTSKHSDRSLLELTDEATVQQKINELKQHADIVIIDVPGLQTLNKSKEWLQYVDKFVTVFKAGKTIHEFDKNQVVFFKSSGNRFIGWVLNKVRDEEINYLMKA